MTKAKSLRPLLPRRSAFALGGALGAFLVAPSALAQSDLVVPLPNVLLLVDTSGSMENKTDGSSVTCNPGNTAQLNEKSRWVDMLEVLTGRFNDYTCEALDRVSNNFKTGEYQLVTGTAPYDWRYPLPYHRPLTGGILGCVAAPGTLPGTAPNPANPFRYPVDPIHYHKWSDTSLPCTQSQEKDGILDAFDTRVRFGLMTFDTEVDPNRGYPGSGDYTGISAVDTAGGQQGLYSYIVGSAAVGKPMGCATPSFPQEVGARNGSAPVWEGRMVNFGNPNDAENVNVAKAKQIQEVLLATRPFGATPIAGMLKDAEDFFWNEASNDPDVSPASAPDPFDDYGPRADPYLSCDGKERQQVVILLTDGEPNMDLRPFCEEAPAGGLPAGECPFERPEEISSRLANPISADRKPIKTYVVGFAMEDVDADLNSATPDVACSTLVTGSTLSSQCAAPGVEDNVPLNACCTLQRIALAGEGEAFFASNAGELRSAISEILRRNVATTSRTQPATAGGSASTGGGFRFFSGFEVSRSALWNGTLRRERWICDDPSNPNVPTPQPFEPGKGDDFALNVNESPPTERRFYTVVPKNSAGDVVNGGGTVRRGIGIIDPDGAGTLAPDYHSGLASAFAGAVPSAAMAIPSASKPPGFTDDQARTFFLQWLLGVNPANAEHHRCENGECKLVGDIFHSTPQVMGAPEERLQDESYVRFTNDQRRRPIVLYTSTNDGFLHAFKVASNDPTETDATAKVLGPGNNELWAFAPPAVLPSLYSLYPFNQQALLDGVATVSDVVAIQPNPATTPPTVFERGATDAQGGGGTWRTVLVQGFGGGRGGYFALDVTNPVPNPSDPENTDKGGPRFLWQLTRDASDNELFGRAGGNPTIATLFFDPLGGSSPREIPVAILPGGPGTPRSSVGGCPEAPEPARTFAGVSIGAGFAARGRVNCYNWGTGDVEKGARSLTIVRLDTGEIIRHFRQKQSEVVNATLRNRTTEAEIDSPITGQPVAFPGRVGAVADRVIVGDQDGRLWKVNVASANPAEWTMTLFFDLYPASILAASGHDFDDGQRVSTPPVLSVDELGNMTVNAATGDQDTLGYSPSQVNYVFSLKEKFDLSRTTAQHEVNWFKTFANGERVVGPLVLFNTNLYFATFLSSDGSNVCDPGTSKVHGMQYITPDDPSNIQNGGEPAPGAASDGVLVEKDGAVIFGVSLAKQPTCFSRVDDDVGNDLIGYQGQTTITQVTPAKFELVMHTSEGSGSPTVPGPAEESIELVKPSSFARVVSWASIIE